MKQLLQFIQNHWILVTAFGATLGLIIFEEFKSYLSGYSQLSPQQATLLMNRDKALIFDLRTPQEFAKGAIAGSVNWQLDQLNSQNTKLLALKTRSIILVTPNDATKAAHALKKLGFTKLAILNGGLKAWKAAHLPVITNN